MVQRWGTWDREALNSPFIEVFKPDSLEQADLSRPPVERKIAPNDCQRCPPACVVLCFYKFSSFPVVCCFHLTLK